MFPLCSIALPSFVPNYVFVTSSIILPEVFQLQIGHDKKRTTNNYLLAGRGILHEDSNVSQHPGGPP